MAFTVPGLGAVTEDGDWLVTGSRDVPVLGKRCRFLIDGYEPQNVGALVACLDTFCSLETADLKAAASDHVFAFYGDVAAEAAGEPGFPQVSEPDEVWDFVTLTDEPLLQRDGATWFVVLENECSWEPEHGLMIVLRGGREVIKVGPYDGHLTNRHAFGDDSIPSDSVYWNPLSSR